MDVYRQASEICQKVVDGKGSAKGLCLQKHVQKKRSTYAVVCETLKNIDLLRAILADVGFFEMYPDASPYLALVFTYDAILGHGIGTQQHHLANAVFGMTHNLRDSYEMLKGKFLCSSDLCSPDVPLPRYARMNTLCGMSERNILGALRKRGRQEDSGRTHNFEKDPCIPSVLRFPAGTDLHRHPLVKGGHLVLQDRSSCIPACVLLNAVSVVRADGRPSALLPLRIVDACAAPGNKTTQLAALLSNAWANEPKITPPSILAVEKDPQRAELLRSRVQLLGANNFVTVVNGDFLTLERKQRNDIDAILLDPTCSSSGVNSRADRCALRMPLRRVLSLVHFQVKVLQFALSKFPSCQRVVYSTCSVNEEENEGVVRAVMHDKDVSARWELSWIMPDEWQSRGMVGVGLPFNCLSRCIRCTSEVEEANGFFVACFDRKSESAQHSE